MPKNIAALFTLVALLLPTFAGAAPHRSHAAIAAFKKQHPCPATGQPKGRCPGYIIDHVKALCAGGVDAPNNMQWQTVAEAKAKDRDERSQCRAIRRQQFLLR